jgi:hypothetical protein
METLKTVWQTWKRIGQKIGDFIARIILTGFYFTIFAPFGLAMRLWGDPLGIRENLRAEWVVRDNHDLSVEDTRRLF